MSTGEQAILYLWRKQYIYTWVLASSKEIPISPMIRIRNYYLGNVQKYMVQGQFIVID